MMLWRRTIKRLRIRQKKWEVGLEDLQVFTSIEQLEINLHSNQCKQKKKLYFPNLRVLVLSLRSEMYQSTGNLEIDSPNLQALAFDFDLLRYLEFTDPLTIKHLKINYFNFDYSTFKSVERLDYDLLSLTPNILSILPKLTELQLVLGYRHPTYIIQRAIRDEFSTILQLIMNEKVKQNRELKIYYHGVQLFNSTDLLEVNAPTYIPPPTLSTLMNNYKSLKDLHWIRVIDYGNLVSLCKTGDLIPADFHSKFNNIQQVCLSDAISNEDRFLSFLSNCKNLYELKLDDVSLSQAFYDNLGDACNSLTSLTIEHVDDVRLDFEFLFKIFYLQQFNTNQSCAVETILQFDRLSYLANAVFEFNGKIIGIRRSKNKCYGFVANNDFLRILNQKIKFNIGEIIHWLNYITSKELTETRTTRSGNKMMRTE